MPFGRYPVRRRPRTGGIPLIHSTKNVVNQTLGVSASTNLVINLVNAIDTPVITNANNVLRSCTIKSVFLEFWYYGTAAGDTNNIFDMYVIKNPGNNLTVPDPGTVGTSNEKKYVFREWKGLAGNKALGGYPYNWKGRLRIPKPYQRFGQDDRLVLVVRSATAGNFCHTTIYKWFT